MADFKIPVPVCAHCELPIAADPVDDPEQLICECYYCDVCDCHYTREDPCLYH